MRLSERKLSDEHVKQAHVSVRRAIARLHRQDLMQPRAGRVDSACADVALGGSQHLWNRGAHRDGFLHKGIRRTKPREDMRGQGSITDARKKGGQVHLSQQLTCENLLVFPSQTADLGVSKI